MAYIYALLSLAITCYDEAGGQGPAAMQFVADTVINRTRSDKFPDTVKDVIYQKGQFVWTGKHKHANMDDLSMTMKRMSKWKDPHGQHGYIWMDAISIAYKSMSSDYKPKTNALFFSTRTIKAHSTSYRYRHNK